MALKYHFQEEQKRVLVIAQTAGDASLKYGMLKNFSTDEIIESAINENRDAKVYIKIHPDVLSGKKKSDINIEKFRNKCTIITENINPISLLKNFSKVYTKTSGMGFEALLVGCKCICFGMPFYAGWGITEDRTVCKRRKRELCIENVFAGAYILYTTYSNPYTNQKSNIIKTLKDIEKNTRFNIYE
jgi:capsular polysaccharide export protein